MINKTSILCIVIIILIGCFSAREDIDIILRKIKSHDNEILNNTNYIIYINMNSFSCIQCIENIRSTLNYLNKINDSENIGLIIVEFKDSHKLTPVKLEKYFRKKIHTPLKIIPLNKDTREIYDRENFMLLKYENQFIKIGLPVNKYNFDKYESVFRRYRS